MESSVVITKQSVIANCAPQATAWFRRCDDLSQAGCELCKHTAFTRNGAAVEIMIFLVNIIATADLAINEMRYKEIYHA